MSKAIESIRARRDEVAKAADYFEVNGFRMAGNVSDGVRALMDGWDGQESPPPSVQPQAGFGGTLQ